MNNFGLSIASAVLCLGMGSAQATFMPWQEGWFFPDFDDPSAPLGFGLDDSRIYEYAGIFIGNVGKPGDGSDTINFSWSGLAAGEHITAAFVVRASLDGGTVLGAGQSLQINLADAQSSAVIRTIGLNAGAPVYQDPSFVFDPRAYRMTVSPAGLGANDSINYSIDFLLAPVPEPASAMLFIVGLLALVRARRATA